VRIALTGKGGSGKTTIAATIARLYARRGYRVNALDGDPNPNLAAALGVPADEATRLRRVPREAILDERTDNGGQSHAHLARPLDEVLAEFGVEAPDRVGVLTMTGLLGAGQGCICGQHGMVREVMEQLADRPSDEVTILDTEASIEHLSRGTVRNVDALLVVTEPYYRSLETAGRVVPLARELGIERVWVIANKVRDERDRAAIHAYAGSHDLEILGIVPYDERVAEADRRGRALVDHDPTSPAVVAIAALADSIAARIGSPAPSAG
jgi:CO dehydrogenase maturation factor